jgi:thioredoxin reductase (NADPH)
VTLVHVRDLASGETAELRLPGAFVFVGLDPNTGFLDGSAVRRDERGFVLTGHALVHDGDRPAGFAQREPAPFETSVPGVFAVGDLRAGSTRQVASAAGDGVAAALQLRDHLQRVAKAAAPLVVAA